MNEETELKVKRLAAFCISMQHGEGIMSKSPDYLLEKHAIAMSLPADFLHQMFDDHGAKLRAYCTKMRLNP